MGLLWGRVWVKTLVLTKYVKFRGELFTNKRFMLDEMTKGNASKFAIFLEYENPEFFSFFILNNFGFLIVDDLV